MGDLKAGNAEYQNSHMALIFKEGLSFSGFERNTFFLNEAGERFQEISGVSGLDSILDGRSVALADFDNDGDYDLFVTAIQEQAHLLYSNNIGQDGGWIRLALVGTASGRDAFGAQVRYRTANGVSTRVKSGGSGFLAQHDPRLLLSLGEAKEADWIEVLWPSGEQTRLGPTAAGSSLIVTEGTKEPVPLEAPRGRMAIPMSADDALWAKLSLKKDQPLPRLKLHPLDPPVQSAALPAGRRLFLNFWATSCGPCRREMPELEKLRGKFEAKGIQLVGVTIDETSDGVREFARSLGVTYPLYRLDAADIGKVFSGLVYIPQSILIDEDGRVVKVFSGWSAETERQIQQLLQ